MNVQTLRGFIVAGVVILLSGVVAPKVWAAPPPDTVEKEVSFQEAEDLVIEGRVTKIVSTMDPSTKQIDSQATITIDKVLSGMVSANEIMLYYVGGTVGELTMRASDEPFLVEGMSLRAKLTPRDEGGYRIDQPNTDVTILSGGEGIEFVRTGPMWYGEDIPVPFHINPNTKDTDDGGLKSSQKALETWTNVSCSYFVFEYDPEPCTAGNFILDGKNCISWTKDSGEGALARATWWYSGDKILESDILFYDEYNWSINPFFLFNQYDIESVALHELGHSLGLAHETADSSYVMYPSIAMAQKKRVLKDDDINGVCAIYPLSQTPPETPSNLVITAVSRTQIDLTWTDNSHNETGFRIEQSEDGVNWYYVGAVGPNVTSYQKKNLNAYTLYYYRVKATRDYYNNSPYSNVAQARTDGWPDLKILDISFWDDDACIGDSVKVKVGEINDGTGWARPHAVAYYADPSSAGFENMVGSYPMPSIEAGNYDNGEITFTPEVTGILYIKAKTDLYGEVEESDETNNTKQTTLYVGYDTLPPYGSIVINGRIGYIQDYYTNDLTVDLDISGKDSWEPCWSYVKEMRLYYNGRWTEWMDYTYSKQVTLEGTGVQEAAVQYRDGANHLSRVYSDTIIVDLMPPVSSIDTPAGPVYEETFSIDWSASDDISGIEHYDLQYQQNGGVWQDWFTDTTETTATFSGSFGESYCFRVRAEDKAGNIESYPDSEGLTTLQDSQNNVACFTLTVPSVEADLDILSLQAEQDAVCVDSSLKFTTKVRNIGQETAADSQLYYYEADSPLDLSQQVGTSEIQELLFNRVDEVTINHKFDTPGTRYFIAQADGNDQIAEGDEENNIVSLTIKVQEADEKPIGSIRINDGEPYTLQQTVILHLTAKSNACVDGVQQMRFSNDGSDWSSWENYLSTKAWNISSGDGEKTIYVQYQDADGNVSQVYTQTVILDTGAPSSAVDPLAAQQNTSDFKVSWSGSDTSKIECYDIQVKIGEGAWSDWQSCTPTTEAIYSGEEGQTYYFRSRAKDGVGNWENYPTSPDYDSFTTIVLGDASESPSAFLPMILNSFSGQ